MVGHYVSGHFMHDQLPEENFPREIHQKDQGPDFISPLSQADLPDA